MNSSALRQFIENVWQTSIIERLQAYVRIPNKSPAFDPDWQRHGYMDQAIELMAEWCRAQPVARMSAAVGLGELVTENLEAYEALYGRVQ